MKFKILLTALVLFSLLGCKKNIIPPKKVKSMTGTMTPTEGPYWDQKFIADQEVFDEEGRLTNSIKGSFVNNQPGYFYPKSYTYKDGRLIETKDGGETRNEYVYTNNLLTQVNIYYGDLYAVKTLVGKELYEYDSQGRKIKQTAFSYRPGYGRNPPPPNPNGYTTMYEYNANNLVAKEIEEGGSFKAYEYDSHKNVTKVTYTYLPGTTYTNETYTYKYNSRDQIEEIIATDYSGTLLKTNIEYDYDGWLKAKYIFKNLYGVYYQVSAINYEYTYY